MPRTAIHFIYPDIDTGFYTGAHHGLASLIGAVRAAGYGYHLTHLVEDISESKFLRLVGDSGADVFAFSAMTNQFKYVAKFARPLAEATGKPVIVGGVHATLEPGQAARTEGITCACRGEGELFVPAFLQAVESSGNWRKIHGACYVDGDSIRQSYADYVTDLDQLAEPDYTPFDMKRILYDLGGRLSVVVSRGCPFNCAFCCNEALRRDFPKPADYVRIRLPQNAIDLTIKLVEKFNPSSIRFEDDLLLLKASWRGQFLDLYRQKIALPFECNCRADMVTEQLAEQLVKAGCLCVDIGIESGDEYIRNKIMRKNVSNEQIISAFETLHQAGLRTYAYNIVALPFETAEMARRTYDLNRRVKPDGGAVFYFYPYPRTELKEVAERNNLLRDGYEDVGSYTEAPSIRPVHASYRSMRRVYRKLKFFLLLQRFKNFFPLPRVVKTVIAGILWTVFMVFPPIVGLLTAKSGFKRRLRRLAFRV